MKAALISIGDELLIGQVVNTNAAWLGGRLVECGIEVDSMSTIGDVREVIVDEIKRMAARRDLVVVSGGLGPTDDDLTRDAVCDLLNCGMQIDTQQLARIEQRFAARGYTINERSRLQALVPEAARVLPNDYGSAPGLEFVVDGARVVVLPGVPSELRGIFTEHVLPTLASDASAIDRTTILVFGPTESALADMLADLAPLVHDGVTLAYLPSTGGIRLRAMRTRSNSDTIKRHAELVEGIRTRAGKCMVSDDGSLMPEAVGRMLRERKLTVCTAESCTGGLIGKMLTDNAGSSDYYVGGVVAYSNSVKIAMLDVESELIDTHGAVSEQVARAMAEGARKRIGADIAVAVTGVAGPDGGTSEKPVGTVWIAVASGRSTNASLHNLGNERQIVRERAAYIALDMVRRAALDIRANLDR